MARSEKQTKEDLYAKALQSKIDENMIREENTRLQTRLAYMENKFA